jgi:hypothetical protein
VTSTLKDCRWPKLGSDRGLEKWRRGVMKGYRGYLTFFNDSFNKFKLFKPFKTFLDPFDGLNNLNDLNGLNVPEEVLFADLILIANDDGNEFFRVEIALGDP